MALDSDWPLDFCLYCDGQTNDGAYCSQACRAADQEKDKINASPSFTAASSASSSSTSQPVIGRFTLPPAFDFGLHRASRSSISASSTTSSSSSSSSADHFSSPHSTTVRRSSSAATTPSSSARSSYHQRQPSPSAMSFDAPSLYHSTSQPQSGGGLSSKAVKELQQYDDYFDRSRFNHRRSLGL